jgi:carboxypeptidase family protein
MATYAESGFTVSSMSGDWSVRTTYGNPAPFVQFWASGGSTATGEILVRASRSVFYFKSVDLYSSTTPIPYTIKGTRNSSTVFSVANTLPNTFGNFRTVANPNAADAIDTLSITVTNAAAPCCRNPMGLDTIVLTSTPTIPTAFSLNGQVTDSATGAGIPGATVFIADGPNAGRSTRTDASGNYSLAELLQSGFTVNVSASNYVSQSTGVTLTSNQMLSLQLTPQPTTPTPPGAIVIGFNGLIVHDATVTNYTESGFTISTGSAAWVASTTYGHPAPFVEFLAESATMVTGELRLAAGGSTFRFASVDLYSSTTPIPYTIRGLRNSSTVFTVTGSLPNTFGDFRTVANSKATSLIDTLSIVLTNAAASCCRNPMGLDTIVLTR